MSSGVAYAEAPSERAPESLTPAQRLKTAVKRAVGLSGRKRVQVLAGPARGVTMTINFAGETPLYLGMFEWELHGFYRTALHGARLVFDIGGYVGYDALMFAANSPGRVITFEPNAPQAALLAENVAQNPGLAPRIEVSPLAIAGADGEGATTLDSLAARVGVPDFVKLDIDGGEAEALRGGLQTLASNRPHLVVETHSLELERECGALLVECGYRPIIKHNRRVWREHRAGAAHNRWLLAAP